jgi:uncharacterized RDD family membrane protein YckC
LGQKRQDGTECNGETRELLPCVGEASPLCFFPRAKRGRFAYTALPTAHPAMAGRKMHVFQAQDTAHRMRRNSFTIRTPEGIRFTQRLAGPITRFLAVSIDLAAILVISITLSQVLLLSAVINADVALAITTICYFVVSVGYSILLESLWRGQTIGKRVLKIRVVDAEGLRLRPPQIVIRNLLRFIDMLPACYAVGGIVCLISQKYQRIGDFAANTVVIYAAPAPIPDIELLFSGAYNSLRKHVHLAAQLRKSITPDEARLALEAVMRRDQLEPAHRLELFRQLAEHLRTVVAFPEESVEGLTDEQYVRNIVDLIFRPTAETAD